MSEKRRDKRNRILRNGEIQMKDGRYRFQYLDGYGKRHYLYSWRLEKTDPLPKGKRMDTPLRVQEEKLQRDLQDRIDPRGGEMTVVELCERYIATKTGVRHTTEQGYRTVMKTLRNDDFGCRKIKSIKSSDAKLWLIKLQKTDKKSYSLIHCIRGVVRPAFRMAVEDDYIRKNPFDFELQSVLTNDAVGRTAISAADEEAFLEFVKSDPHFKRYYEGLYILFNTGVRIGEFTGLTFKDIDIINKVVHIDHQLQYTTATGFYIENKAKTDAGTRDIPMTDEVCECFKTILRQRKKQKIEPMIDGYTGFLYLNGKGRPMAGSSWAHHMKYARQKYFNVYKRELPNITPHVCRHTFCSKMAKNGMSPKALQKIMGHSDISITLNVYTHLDFEDTKNQMNRVRERMAQ